MTDIEVGIIRLVKSAITGNKIDVPKGFSFENAKEYISRHDLYNLIHFGCLSSSIEEPKYIKDRYLSNCYHLSLLWNEANKVIEAFNSNNIENIPLKGIVNKDRYKDKFMRNMSDVDILIHTKDYKKKIYPIMESLGFKEFTESDHEYVWKKDNIVTIELHKKLIPSYDKDFYKVIKDGWDWYRNDNEFTYLFLHFTKHFRDAGIGISHMVDMFVNWKDNKENVLSEFHLDKFYLNIRSVLDYWFLDKEPNEIDLYISNYIFSSGNFGTKEKFDELQKEKKVYLSGGNEYKARRNDFWFRLFPPYYWMKYKYPILEKWKVLLPFYYIVRVFKALFSGEARRQMKENKEIEVNENNKYIDIGLDYFR